MALGLKPKSYPFSHGAVHALPVSSTQLSTQVTTKAANSAGLTLYDSYHCSRYNTQTRRLTTDMFEQVFEKICANFPSHHKTGD